MSDHPQRHLLERSAGGGPILRCDDVLLLRGDRGTWLIDLQVKVGGVQRRLQVPIGRHKALSRLATEIDRAEAEQDALAGSPP